MSPEACPEESSVAQSQAPEPAVTATDDPTPAGSTATPEPTDPLQGGEEPRRLHPLPRGLVELYGLLAVLFVLVPEWMAGGALASLREGRLGSDLPVTAGAWRRVPELRLASMNLAELRQLASQWRLRGYGRLDREQLTARLLRQIQARSRKPL